MKTRAGAQMNAKKSIKEVCVFVREVISNLIV